MLTYSTAEAVPFQSRFEHIRMGEDIFTGTQTELAGLNACP